MRAKNSSGEQQGRTFTEAARRAQIVAAAIEAIAEFGYAKTSFAKIAKLAGLSSTGMISYHFAGKEDLVDEVIREVYRVATEFMQPRIRAASGHRDMLRTYIESNIELQRDHPRHMRALLDILLNARDTTGKSTVDTKVLDSRLELIEAHLRDGQRAGEFGEFDPHVMAVAICGGIDAVITRDTSEERHADHSRWGRELAEIFVRATRPQPRERQ